MSRSTYDSSLKAIALIKPEEADEEMKSPDLPNDAKFCSEVISEED